MREALHVIDNEVYRLPYLAGKDEVENYKKLAKKEIYKCPYCEAKLIVKNGDQRGLYFSHQHSEACMESRVIEKAEKRYSKQTERETKRHSVIVDIIHDELKVKSKINKGLYVNNGYREKSDWKEYPDIYVKSLEKEYAISVITNVNALDDTSLAQKVKARHNYFIDKGLEPIWFVERNEQAIEREKNSIILWHAELTISSKTQEDIEWESLIAAEVKNNGMFFNLFNYPGFITHSNIDVNSLYYIFDNGGNVVVKVQRVIKDRTDKPYRAFLINEGYEIPFSEALVIEDGFKLSNKTIENDNRINFLEILQTKRKLHEEYLRNEEEKEKRKFEEAERERKQKKELQEIRLKELINQRKKEKVSTVLSYNDLKSLLKKKIGLTQKEQMELWTKYMLGKIGPSNSKVVWEIVTTNNCENFNDLKAVLDNIYFK
ncbi:hypothetical protein JOC85_003078 [Bacillus mesophilus]|uniref:Competence protein CoiA-like family n=1 Tax=Bacillus mesophilus TaxID=1808955 RepID=A0A6M0Q9R0_9BACI|nr:competence protein CoiA family protein [Bacillus mesophilus]MBM7662271.1 hypothetical protein [Bacillus mesophilus]NEY73094.1 competence protein CoiA-like family [Bacillus mesophilus]